jgi:hypothetical protein
MIFNRAENASLILGPYQLEVGSNRSWSSKLENSFIEESYFPSRNGSEGLNTEGTGVQTTVPTTPTSDLFDLMICLAPMNMTDRTELFTVMPQVTLTLDLISYLIQALIRVLNADPPNPNPSSNRSD